MKNRRRNDWQVEIVRADIKERIEKINRGEVPEGYKNTKVGIIPADWNIRKFDDVVEINPKKEVLNDEEEVSFIAMEDISNEGRIIKRNTKPYGEVNKGYTFFKNDDVLLAKITPCFENGKKALASKLTNNIGFGSTEFHVIRANNHDIAPSYIYYIISTNRFIHQAEANMTGTAGQKRVPTNFLREYKMCIPSLKEQQKVTSILSTWDKAIELKEKLIQQKKEQKKGLMQNLLTGKVRLKGFDEKWKYLKAGDIFVNVTDKSHGGIGTVLSSTQDKGIIPRDLVGIDIKFDKENLSSYKKVNKGEFVISLRSFQGGIEYSEYEGLLSPAYTILKNKVDISNSFYKHLFKSNDFITRLNGLIYGIRDGKQIGFKDFSVLKLPYPKVEEQNEIAQILDHASEEIELHEKELESLKEQKKGLMQLLLTGKVRVEC